MSQLVDHASGGPLSAPPRTSVSVTPTGPLDADQLSRLDAWWRAANYLSVGQIYLMDNPLLREPLRPEHVKPQLLGHWATTPGLTFIYAHLNRAISARDLEIMHVIGPGHGGPGLVAAGWLEGTYSEVYPDTAQDEEGMRRLFTQFSLPGGIPTQVAARTPGSIHQGGGLGHSLSHAYGAAFDNPELIVAAVVGDGEAETGALATSWHSNKFLDPRRDGVVLPILELNGYTMSNPTLLARMGEDELMALLRGYGHTPYLVSGSDPEDMHQTFAATLDHCLDEIAEMRRAARGDGDARRRSTPMIVLRSPQGWTGPREVDGVPMEGTWRAHRVPLSDARTHQGHREILEDWLRSYRPEELFDSAGFPVARLRELHPVGDRRMSASPHANGGLLLRDLQLPDYRGYGVPVDRPGSGAVASTRVLAIWLRDVMAGNLDSFRMFSPDEDNASRLLDVLDVTGRARDAGGPATGDHLAFGGRVMEILSEHTCEGWLEGYLLSGRHGLFSCQEGFIHVIDSMVKQHATWLESTHDIPWRRPIASLNYLLASYGWRQDHQGFSHQDPGFLDFVIDEKASVVRAYLPPDANCLLSVADHCLRSRQYVNVIVAGKQPCLQYLDMDAAVEHCAKGIGIWSWASNDQGQQPDVVMGCAGDVATKEVLAAVDLLRGFFPDLLVRVVNVVDLMRLGDDRAHAHGLSDADFDALFTVDKPVVFAYHGYPWLIHRLTYKRTNHRNFHVRGYREEGTTTTPFDMTVVNRMDRFHLAIDVIDRVPRLHGVADHAREWWKSALVEHASYVRKYGEDLPDVAGWEWGNHDVARSADPTPEVWTHQVFE